VVIPGAGRVGRTNALLILAPLVLVVADLIVYGVLLTSQGRPPPDSAAIVPFVSGYMLLMAVVLALTLGGHPFLVTMRPAMLAAAAAGLLLFGFFALFSIGLPLLVAGILAAIAGLRAALAGRSLRNALLAEGAAALIAVTLLVGGFEVTQRIILCPSSGTMGGSSSGFLTGSYHYQCVNGTLTKYSGDCNGAQGGVDANGNPTSTNGC
jgi:hypothetical protein